MDVCGQQVLNTTQALTIGACAEVELPTEFGQLTRLTTLTLGGNGLAKLPTEFGQLTQLTTLDLSENLLAQLPTEFGQLIRLTTLDLRENSLLKLSTEVGQLAQLTTLDLSENLLAQLPTEFGQLIRLTTLTLGGNGLAKLPTEFGQLTQLTTLDLSENLLAQLPTEFGQLIRLTTLDLRENSLLKLSTEVGQLAQLTTLGLSENLLAQLPTEIGLLAQLDTLYLSKNSVAQLPTEIGQLTQLESLTLTENRLAQLPTEFGQLTQLDWLALDVNSLEQLPTEIGQLAQLTTLYLGGNVLEQLPTEVGRLTKLNILSLAVLSHYGKFWWGSCGRTPYLNSNTNRLHELPNEIGQLTLLKSLSLQQNNLSALPTEFGQLTKLICVHLEHNNLSLLPTEVGQLTRLRRLRVESNRLEALPTEIGQLKQFSSLELKSNRLETLPTEVGQLVQLTRLLLTSNRLEALPTEVGLLTGLRWLDLKSNELKAVPTEVGQLPRLNRLGLESNRLKALPTEFGQLPWLGFLNLSRNDLTDLPPQLVQLTALDLSWNRMLPTQIGYLTGLVYLDISPNKLTTLPTQVGRLTALTSLSLDVTNMSMLPTQLGELSVLKRLLLEYEHELALLPTQVKNLDALLLKLTALTEVYVAENKMDGAPVLLPPTNVRMVAACNHLEFEWDAAAFEGDDLVRLFYSAENTMLRIEFEGSEVQPFDVVVQNASAVVISLVELFEARVTTGLTSQNLTVRARTSFQRVNQVVLLPRLTHTLWSLPLFVTTCPAFMQQGTESQGDKCVAITGFYRGIDGKARSCADLARKLPPGAFGNHQCLDKIGTEVQSLPVAEGFWRASVTSESIRMCPTRAFCMPRKEHGLRLFQQVTSPRQYCTENNTGTYCEDCVEDSVPGPNGCVYCTKEDKRSPHGLVVFMAISCLTFLGLYVYVLLSSGFLLDACCGQRRTRSGTGTRRPLWKKAGFMCDEPGCEHYRKKTRLMTKVRILFGYFQVLSSYQRTFLKQSIHDSGGLLGFVSLLSNLDLTWVVSSVAIRCTYDYDFYHILLVVTLSPIVLTSLQLFCTTGTVFCCGMRATHLNSVVRQNLAVLFLLLFLIYPYVSQTVLATFWCESFPEADAAFNLTTSALRVDYRLSCDHEDNRRRIYVIYAASMVLVYPIGVFVLFASSLYVWKDQILAPKDSTAEGEQQGKLKAVGFLVKPYKAARFWFEAYELIRKLVQTIASQCFNEPFFGQRNAPVCSAHVTEPDDPFCDCFGAVAAIQGQFRFSFCINLTGAIAACCTIQSAEPIFDGRWNGHKCSGNPCVC